jgi:hypothetical protein
LPPELREGMKKAVHVADVDPQMVKEWLLFGPIRVCGFTCLDNTNESPNWRSFIELARPRMTVSRERSSDSPTISMLRRPRDPLPGVEFCHGRILVNQLRRSGRSELRSVVASVESTYARLRLVVGAC